MKPIKQGICWGIICRGDITPERAIVEAKRIGLQAFDFAPAEEWQRIKDAGLMVGDREVVGILFRRLLEPEYRDGCILDGFQRTKVQVECLKLFVDRMQALWREFTATPFSIHFRQPTIHIMVLFVD